MPTPPSNYFIWTVYSCPAEKRVCSCAEDIYIHGPITK